MTNKYVYKKYDEKSYIFKMKDHNKPTIVFIHGFASDKNSHQSIPIQFPEYNYLSIDLPGHGNEINNYDILELDYFAFIVWNLIEELKINKIIFIGHSMGAGVVVIANKYLNDKIICNILETPINGSICKNLDILQKLLPRSIKESTEVIDAMFFNAKEFLGKQYEKFIKNTFEESKNKFLNLGYLIQRNNLLRFNNLVDEYYVFIRKPTIALLGIQDKIVLVESEEHIKKINNNIKFELLDSCAHVIEFQCQERFFLIIKNFIKKL